MRTALSLLLSLLVCLSYGQLKPPLVIYEATISPTHVAFSFAGHVWEVSRSGGAAKRITQGPDSYRYPVYTRDGARIAFLRSDAGEANVCVVPARGGEPKQITFHPGIDIPWSFSPDGRSIALSSNRGMVSNLLLFEAPVEGVMETRIPVPTGSMASYSPDGTKIAYVARPPLNLAINRRNERGGTRSRVEVFRRADGTGTPVTPGTHNSLYPMWIGERIYFVQDRRGSYNLACYDLATRRIREITAYSMSGITHASSDGQSIVFVRDGRLFLVDPKDEKPREIDFSIDLSALDGGSDERTARKVPATRFVQSFTMAPDGDSVVIEARGEAMTKPMGGDPAVNHTRTPAVAEREPTVSPN